MPAPSQDTDLPVDAARRGDPGAWDILLQRYQQPLFTYVAGLLHNHDEQAALDLLQETYQRAFRHLHTLRDNQRFGSWLFGIAHQLVLQTWRRQNRSPFSDQPVPDIEPDPDPGPDLALARAEDAAHLAEAIDTLAPELKSVVLLHYLEDFSLADIAAALGTPVGTVKSRLFLARRHLRERLAQPAASPHTRP